MKPALALPARPDERWTLSRQIGVEYAVPHPAMGGATMESGTKRSGGIPQDFDELLRMKNAFEGAGFEVPVLEGDLALSDTTRLGLPGRDEEIERFNEAIRSLGAVGIPVLCYSWMTHFWWLRNSTHIPLRGESFTTGYDHEEMQRGPEPPNISTTEEDLWDNLEYFLERVVPVAEEAGVKLAIHPDDPPLSPVRGVNRILRSVEAFDRLLELYPSDHNGLTFCQGNFAAMGVDIPDTIRHFGDDIHFVHFRDVEGTAERFVETWHDEGPTDMLAAIEAYRDIGYSGALRPDHVPTMLGEGDGTPGYEMKGRLFVFGYMKGLLEQSADGG